MTRRRIDEATLRIYKVLLERFGEPIGKSDATVGAKDEGPGGKSLWKDPPKKDREWSDPDVIRETDEAPPRRRWFIYNVETGTDLADYEATSKEDALRQFKEDLDPDEELLSTVTAVTRDDEMNETDAAAKPKRFDFHNGKYNSSTHTIESVKDAVMTEFNGVASDLGVDDTRDEAFIQYVGDALAGRVPRETLDQIKAWLASGAPRK